MTSEKHGGSFPLESVSVLIGDHQVAGRRPVEGLRITGMIEDLDHADQTRSVRRPANRVHVVAVGAELLEPGTGGRVQEERVAVGARHRHLPTSLVDAHIVHEIIEDRFPHRPPGSPADDPAVVSAGDRQVRRRVMVDTGDR